MNYYGTLVLNETLRESQTKRETTHRLHQVLALYEAIDMMARQQQQEHPQKLSEETLSKELEMFEAFDSEANRVLKSYGLHIHKTKGLIDYLRLAGKGVAQLFVAAVKGDKEKVAEIKQSVKKGEVMDFFLKLDMATLHLVTGPIHMIDAITGWDLWSNLQAKAKSGPSSIVQELISAIRQIKDRIREVVTNRKKVQRVLKHVEELEAELVKA